MYSKSKGITDREYSLTPPPGYDGSRFRRRSDGRDDTFPYYGDGTDRPARQEDQAPLPVKRPHYRNDGAKDTAKEHSLSEEEDCLEEKNGGETFDVSAAKKDQGGALSFLQSLNSDDILLLALIVLLAGGGDHERIDVLLVLALLLCIS